MKQQAAGSGRQAATAKALFGCLLPAACCLLFGCYRQEMARQPKYHWPDMPSEFFADGHANRPIEADTVARGQLRDDESRFTGLTGPGRPDAPDYATEFPYPVDEAMLTRGRERFNIYCAACHGRAGNGDGKIVERGYLKPPSYHTDDSRGLRRSGKMVPLRDAPVGYFFGVITHGYGGMPDYAEQVPVDDRWAIIAYIRVLQYSQNVPAAELTDADRAKLRTSNGAEGNGGH
jgi:mono/diheme cytochrome c family protein